jgi:hypothetical protein
LRSPHQCRPLIVGSRQEGVLSAVPSGRHDIVVQLLCRVWRKGCGVDGTGSDPSPHPVGSKIDARCERASWAIRACREVGNVERACETAPCGCKRSTAAVEAIALILTLKPCATGHTVAEANGLPGDRCMNGVLRAYPRRWA